MFPQHTDVTESYEKKNILIRGEKTQNNNRSVLNE